MKNIVITDTHFGIKQNSITWLNSQLDFIYNQLIPYLKDCGGEKRLIHCGDVFDSRSTVSVLVATKVKEAFSKLASLVDEFIIIGGNHDYYSPNSNEYDSLHLILGDIKGITLVTKDILIKPDNDYKSRKGCVFIPWYEWGRSDIQDIVYKYGIRNIFAHTDIVGGEIPYKDVRIFSGHMHIPITRKKYGLYNLGSTYALNFADANSDRGFYVIDGNNVEFIPNKYSIKFWRLYNEDIFKEFNGDEKDYIELYINQYNLTKENYNRIINDFTKKYKNLWIIPQTSDDKSIESIKFDGYDIEKIIEENIPEDLMEKFNKIKEKCNECI